MNVQIMMMLNVDTDSTTCHAIYILFLDKSIHMSSITCMHMMCSYVLDASIFFIAHLEHIGLSLSYLYI